jgi:hypothetical protein
MHDPEHPRHWRRLAAAALQEGQLAVALVAGVTGCEVAFWASLVAFMQRQGVTSDQMSGFLAPEELRGPVLPAMMWTNDEGREMGQRMEHLVALRTRVVRGDPTVRIAEADCRAAFAVLDQLERWQPDTDERQ